MSHFLSVDQKLSTARNPSILEKLQVVRFSEKSTSSFRKRTSWCAVDAMIIAQIKKMKITVQKIDNLTMYGIFV